MEMVRRVQPLQLGGGQVVGDHVHGVILSGIGRASAPSCRQDMIKRSRVQEI
jgi:hypothetical protein